MVNRPALVDQSTRAGYGTTRVSRRDSPMTPPGQAMTGNVDGSVMPLPYAPVRNRGLSPTLSSMARTPSDSSSFIHLETPGSGSGSGPQSDLPFEVDAQQWSILHQYRAMAATSSGGTVVMETVMASPGAIAAQQAQMQAERLQNVMTGAEALTERNRALEQNLLQNSLSTANSRPLGCSITDDAATSGYTLELGTDCRELEG